MSTTNHTLNYELSQYVDNDVTSYLTNYNSDMTKIDAQMKRNADSAQTAEDNATIAVSTATTAASNASTALSTANTANATAESAQTAAQNAQTASRDAQTDAAAALRASASNNITNLAPAYDPTLTYNVGDLVTYIFPDTNHGHLYKCIVAVTVPEEFDVNKWDDVTTSEVYMDKSALGDTIYTLPFRFPDGGGTTITIDLLSVPSAHRWRPVLILARFINTSGVYMNRTIDAIINLGTTTLSSVDARDISNTVLTFSATCYGDGTIMFF